MVSARLGTWRARSGTVVAVLLVGLALLAVGQPLLGLVAMWIAITTVAVGGGDALVRVLRVLPALLGWLLIVAAIDWGAGTLWNEVAGDEVSAPSAGADVLDLTGDLPTSTDPRRHLPAYDGSAWADRYFAELDALDYQYIPFLGPRVASVRSRYTNSLDGVRRSYEPTPPAGVEPLEVWFLGGSTTWGEGQRDEYTVASQVARVAEEHGTYLHVVNMGERGYTAFQEFLLLQEELDEREPPDLVVFFDGINEVGTRGEADPSQPDQPAIFQYALMADTFGRVPPLPDVTPTVEPSIKESYLEVSLFNKLLRHIGGLATVSPAGAQDAPPAEPPDMQEVLSIFARSVDLAAMVADRHDVPVERFWQPIHAQFAQNESLPTFVSPEDLPPGVHDIEDAYVGFDQESIFIDGAHTNELGSRIAAEAMWPYLAPVLDRLAAPR